MLERIAVALERLADVEERRLAMELEQCEVQRAFLHAAQDTANSNVRATKLLEARALRGGDA